MLPPSSLLKTGKDKGLNGGTIQTFRYFTAIQKAI